jgi:hypothetical protein
MVEEKRTTFYIVILIAFLSISIFNAYMSTTGFASSELDLTAQKINVEYSTIQQNIKEYAGNYPGGFPIYMKITKNNNNEESTMFLASLETDKILRINVATKQYPHEIDSDVISSNKSILSPITENYMRPTTVPTLISPQEAMDLIEKTKKLDSYTMEFLSKNLGLEETQEKSVWKICFGEETFIIDAETKELL